MSFRPPALRSAALGAAMLIAVLFVAALGRNVAAQNEPVQVFLPAVARNVGAPGSVPNTPTPTATGEPAATPTGTVEPTATSTTGSTATPTATATDEPAATSTGTVEPTATSTTEPTSTPTATLEPPPPVETVVIPAGSFQMGCDATHDTCLPDEEPLHTVTLDAYSIDKYEVSNAHYYVCMSAGVCTAPASINSLTRAPYFGPQEYATYPVIYVSWHQASTYCEWLGKRLPSEAEWEKAARGDGDTRIYPWGDATPTCGTANFEPSCVGDTAAVGSYATGASPYSAMDMSGNVSEWVNDWYDEDYYATSPADNPTGPASGELRVLRGGGWHFFEDFVRVANRFKDNPGNTELATGFRCATSE